MAKKVVMDLQYWFNRLSISKELNEYAAPYPPIKFDDDEWLIRGSFIQLLFDDDYPYSTYYTTFRVVTDLTSLPDSFKRRAMIYAGNIHIYRGCDSTDSGCVDCNSNGLFPLSSTSRTLLNGILQYRMDSTAAAQLTLSGVTYSTLTSTLDKLMYLFLDLKVNQNYSRYNNLTLLTNDTSTTLEKLYEIYVIEQFFISLDEMD